MQKKQIPRGNTQKNVNKTVLELIKPDYFSKKVTTHVLDIPCGEAQFSNYLASEYPHFIIDGVDPFAIPKNSKINFHQQDATNFFKENNSQNYDLIMCISGIMCFDNLPVLFSEFKNNLKTNSQLILTNDNILTFRDRLNFLLFGHPKRFSIFYKKNEGNWNIVPIQTLYMLYERNIFKDIEIKYCSIYIEDFLLIPFALINYLIFLPYILSKKSNLSWKTKLKLFPFKSMIARHYVMSGYKTT